MNYAAFRSIGAYVPEKILTNDDLTKMVDTSDEWIFKRTGIKERRIAAKDEKTSDMGTKAAALAIERSGIAKEDIDLVVRKKDGETGNQLKTKIKKITKIVSEVLPEIEIPGVTHKFGMNRKTAHSYTKLFHGEYGQIRDMIVVEATWLGYYEPYTTKEVSSYIYEMMVRNKQQKIAEENGILPFEVQVLEPKRTLCEKIMSLVRFSYTENPIEDLKNKVRHTYDLHQLLQNKELNKFFESGKFDEMLLKVANDDVESFRNNNSWLQYHPIKAKIFAELEDTWRELKSVYSGNFSNLVFGELPSESEIYETLKLIKERLVSVNWTVTIENPK